MGAVQEVGVPDDWQRSAVYPQHLHHLRRPVDLHLRPQRPKRLGVWTVHDAWARLRGWRIWSLRGRWDQRLDELVSEADDLIRPHVAPNHAVVQARLKRLINNAPAPGEIGLAALDEFLKR